MKINEVLKVMMKRAFVSQILMASKLGLAQPNIASRLVRTNLMSDNILDMLDVCGYEMVIRPKDTEEQYKSPWEMKVEK